MLQSVMAPLFRLTPWILSLVLALGTLAMAQARGQMAAVAWIEICTGHGAQTVPVSAGGTPVSLHTCPDCLAAHGVALLPDTVEPVGIPVTSRQLRPATRRALARPAPARPRARGPPQATAAAYSS